MTDDDASLPFPTMARTVCLNDRDDLQQRRVLQVLGIRNRHFGAADARASPLRS